MFPFFRRPYYYYAQNGYRNSAYNIKQKEESVNERQDYIKHQNANKNESTTDTSRKAEKKKTILEKGEAPIFEIFGIKLYFDDILIMALLFFLYSEGVEDNLLFISLILLLLS